jgi:hypothetical protein
MPPDSGLAETVLSALGRIAWMIAPTLALAGAGYAAYRYLPEYWPGPRWVLVVAALVLVWMVTLRPQARHARRAYLRSILPMRLRQAGIVNHTGETPAVYRIKHFPGGLRIELHSTGGHPASLFEQHTDALCAALNAVDVEVGQARVVVILTVVRCSAHDTERVNTWE